MSQPGEYSVQIDRDFDMSRPGEYVIQLSRHINGDTDPNVVKSNTITVTVLPPDASTATKQ